MAATGTRIAGLIQQRRCGALIQLSFSVCFEELLGLKLRQAEAGKAVRRALAGLNSEWVDDPPAVHFKVLPEVEVSDRHRVIVIALANIACRPFTPRLVRQALNISNVERIRWTKDGRLSQSGATYIRRGQIVAVRTYRVEDIEPLAERPERIEAWRSRDRDGS